MFLHLNPQSGLPVYRQMLQQFRERIGSGQLAAGSQLPSVRELSTELHINPLTVSKVYQLLEKDGLVEFRRGQGTFVTADRVLLKERDKTTLIQPAIEQLVSEAIHLGLTEATLHDLIHKAYEHRQH